MDRTWIETLRNIHFGLFRLLSGGGIVNGNRKLNKATSTGSFGVDLKKLHIETGGAGQTACLLAGLKAIVRYHGYNFDATSFTSGRTPGPYFLNQEMATRLFDLLDKKHADPLKGTYLLRVEGVYDSLGMYGEGKIAEAIKSKKIDLQQLEKEILAGNPALMIGIHHAGILTDVQLDWINQSPVLQKAMFLDPCRSDESGKEVMPRACNLAERSLFIAICLAIESCSAEVSRHEPSLVNQTSEPEVHKEEL